MLRLGRHLQHPAARDRRELRDRKAANINSVRPDVVATGNIGCITQLATGMDMPIAHTVELLDWAYGGPVPRGLEALARHVHDVPEAEPADRTQLSAGPPSAPEIEAMRIGVPKEIKVHEYRVGMTPASVREAVEHGHEVLVEHDAAARQGISDDDYRRAGATVLQTAAEVFAKADLIVKVKEPQPAEFACCVRARRSSPIFTWRRIPSRPRP